MSNMPSANRRPVAAVKSRKRLFKQPGSFAGRSQPQPQANAGTPLPVAPLLFGNQSNAQFSFNSGTLPAEDSSLPEAPLVFGNQTHAPSSFNSGTLSAEDSSLPAAPLAFGNRPNAQFLFNSGTEESSLPAAPPVFGNQSNAQFEFNSGTLPTEESSLPAVPLDFDNQPIAQSALTSGTQLEEESIEKMVAGMEADLAKSPTPSGSNLVPRDPNYGLDMTFGLNTDFTPAIPNVAQDPNATQYPDPGVPTSGGSLPYFVHDPNIRDPELPRPSFSQDPTSAADPSFISGVDIAQHSVAQDPVAQSPSFDRKLNFPLDPSLRCANEHGNPQAFAASTVTPAPSATQYPDPNPSDTARSLPNFVQDSKTRDPELPRPSFFQDPTSTVDPSFISGLNIAQNPVAQDPSFDRKLNFPLDPSLGLANERRDSQPFAASTVPPAPNVTQYPDPTIPDTARSLPYFGRNSDIQHSELCGPIFSQDPKPTVDHTFVPNLNVAQDSRFQQVPSFPLDPNLDLANEPDSSKPFAASIVAPASSVTQHSDPNIQGPTCSLPCFVQDSTTRDSELPRPTFSQDPKSAVDPSFITNLDVAQDSSTQQVPSFPLDPSLRLADELYNSKPFAASTVPPALGVDQYPDPNVPDTACSLPYFVQDSTMRDSEVPHPNFSQNLKSAADPSYITNLDAQDSSFHQQPSFVLDPPLERNNLNPAAVSNAPPAPGFAQDPNVPDLASFPHRIVQDSNNQDPELLRPKFSQDPKSAVDPSFLPNLNVARDSVIQDSSLQQELRFPLDPNLGLASEHGNIKPIAAFSAPQAPNIAQVPNVPDLAGFLPNFVQDSTAQDPELPLPKFSQGPKSAGDPELLLNHNVARDPVIQDLSFQQEPGVPLDPNLGLAIECGSFKPVAAYNVPSAPNVVQAANVSDPACFSPDFVQDSTSQALKLPLPKTSQDPKSMVDPTSSFVPNLNIAQNPSAQASSFPLDPNLGFASKGGNLQPVTAPAQNLIQPQSTNFENQAQYQDLQSNLGLQINVSDQIRAFDIDRSELKQDQFVKAPGFPQTPSTGSGQNADVNEDSRFDLMDLEPDYKITPPSWKHNQVPENKYDTLEPGRLPEHSTDPNPVLTSSHISSSVAFLGPAQNLEASAEGADLNGGFDQVQTRKISSGPATENVAPKFDSIASKVSGLKFKQSADIAPEPTASHQEATPKVNAKEKRSTIATSANLRSKLPSPPTSTDKAAASHLDPVVRVQSETIDQREMKRMRAEIERKNKEISDKDDKIRRCAQELQDEDKKNMLLIRQLRGDLDNLREEKLTLEKANDGLARENRETSKLQGKAEKNTDLIRKLSVELGRLRKKQSTLEKANESLAKANSELNINSDSLCQSNLSLKEENRNLRASIDDLRPLTSELDEAKETILAQKAEIQDSTQSIARLNACIDKISPELLWRTEQLQEAEDLVSHEESVSKYYRDKYSLLWNKHNALESAGDSRETEFAKLELAKEQRHIKELEALNFQIAGLQVENKRLAHRVGDAGGSVNSEEGGKVDEKACDPYDDNWTGFTNQIEPQVQELPLPKDHPDENQKLPEIDEEVRNPIHNVFCS